jgi:hypothetical protein
MGILDIFKKRQDDSLGLTDNLGLNTGADAGLNVGEQYQLEGLGNPTNSGLGQQQGPSNFNMLSNMNNGTRESSALGAGMNAQQYAPQPQLDIGKELQILSLKLDAIKSELDAMGQRVHNIEMIAEKEQAKQGQQKRWY